MRPSPVEQLEDGEGVVISRFTPEVQSQLNLSEEAIAALHKAMRLVVDAGTGRRAQIEGLSVGGKTGTAQSPSGLDHAWFICASPVEDPRIGMCVMLEDVGQHGGTVAAPIAKYVLERYARREGWISDTVVEKPRRARRARSEESSATGDGASAEQPASTGAPE